MKSEIRSGITGAKESRGLVVVIDVFRASNTILMLLSRGAASIIPVATVNEAFALKKKHPSFLLAGERKGVTVDGFDLGNSPAEVAKAKVRGKHIVLTTSAGTQGMVVAQKSERILIGSFGNVRILIKTILKMAPPLITWLPVGTEGVRKAVEDELCASYLKEKLAGKTASLPLLLEDIMKGEGAYRLTTLGQQSDFPYCLCENIYNIVPEVRRQDGALTIKRARSE